MALSPVPLSAFEVGQILTGMAHLAGRRHSFDGFIEYHAWDGPPCSLCGGLADSEPGVECERCEGMGAEPLPEGADYWVHGVIRDNSDGGQGFVKMIGTVRDAKGRPLSDYPSL